MAKVRKGARTPHTTLIESAARVAALLRSAGFAPYPGVIDPKGGKGGIVRIRVRLEPGRTRVSVCGGGAQEILLYGAVDRLEIERTLAPLEGRGWIVLVEG